jgi:hypothetical protein
MTRRVITGLRSVGVPSDDPALVEARDFVKRCQTGDGSFVYSPVELALNKGLRDAEGKPRGYGSATTDGLLCMAALELTKSGSFQQGLAWLQGHHRVDRNPGLDGGPMEPFAEAMRGYYRAGAAHCFARFGGPQDWARSLAETIVTEQEADGSFRGKSGLQKEDDPIVGTAFAVQALAAALTRTSGRNETGHAARVRESRGRAFAGVALRASCDPTSCDPSSCDPSSCPPSSCGANFAFGSARRT